MDKITLEMIEKVLDATKEGYHTVKDALIQAGGDVEAAIKSLKEDKPVEAEATEVVVEETEETVEKACTIEPEVEEETKASDDPTLDEYAQKIIERLKKRVQEGNVERIKVSKDGKTILDIPLNIGLLGGIITLATFPWALILGVITAFGLNCKIEIINKDGGSEEM